MGIDVKSTIMFQLNLDFFLKLPTAYCLLHTAYCIPPTSYHCPDDDEAETGVLIVSASRVKLNQPIIISSQV